MTIGIRNIALSLMASLLSLSVSGCVRSNEIVEPPSGKDLQQFPEFFVERGSDADSSYLSLRAVRIDSTLLDIQATSWGITETGLFLGRRPSKRAAVFEFMGDCGTVSTRTWEKVTLHRRLTRADQDTIDRIWLTNFRDTLEVVRTRISIEERFK